VKETLFHIVRKFQTMIPGLFRKLTMVIKLVTKSSVLRDTADTNYNFTFSVILYLTGSKWHLAKL